MLKSMKFEQERAQLVGKLNSDRLTEIRADDAATLEERENIKLEVATLDGRIAQAKEQEADEAEQHRLDHPVQPSDGMKGEAAEFRQLVNSASVGRIVTEIAAGRSIGSGAEAEIQEHYGLQDDFLPIRLLMPDASHRAAASFGAGAATEGTSPGIAGQVFGDSVAGFINAAIRDVPVGTRVLPVITEGALGNVSTPAKSAAVVETDAVLAVKELRPARLQVGFSYALEDMHTYRDLDGGLSRNIREGVRDKMDDVLLNAAAKGLLTSGHSADPTAPGAETTAGEYIAAGAAADGRYAMSEADVRLLVGSGANGVYGHMAATPVATAGDRRVSEVFGARLRVSPNIADYASDMQDAVAILGNQPNVEAALWNAVQIIRDPYSRKENGEVQLTGVAFFDFSILRAGGYIRHRFRTS